MTEPADLREAFISETEITDYDKEYAERFSKAKTEAEKRGLKYNYPTRAGIGWKMHLKVPPVEMDSLTLEIMKFLQKKKYLFKVEKNSGQEGKGMTVYIGDRDTMEDVASELNSLFGNKISPPLGNVLVDDIAVIGNIRARFENVGHYLKNESGQQKYLQYGAMGIPYLRNDYDKDRYESRNEKLTIGQKVKNSIDSLTRDYGTFFTGTRNQTFPSVSQFWMEK